MKPVECGKIVNTHGIAGEVKIENYCDDGFFKRIAAVTVGTEKYRILSSRTHKGFVLAKLEGVNTVEAAMSLKGNRYAPRSRFLQRPLWV